VRFAGGQDVGRPSVAGRCSARANACRIDTRYRRAPPLFVHHIRDDACRVRASREGTGSRSCRSRPDTGADRGRRSRASCRSGKGVRPPWCS
jgi:hypothetical protein